MYAATAEHFVRDPHWTWYILFYFFFAGIAGGCYLISTLLRLRGTKADEPVVRLGFYVAFIMLLCCPPLLILDLGQPLRFWHMMWNLTPGEHGPNFKYWSPMSLGVWGLLAFNGFAAISFIESLVKDGKLRFGLARKFVALLDGGLGKIVNILGCGFGLFIAGYTGVLLAVSNQPLWSDTWTLGGLFLASGLSSAAAVLMLLSRFRRGAHASGEFLHISESYFTAIEILMIAVFAFSLVGTGALGLTFEFPWLLLWAITFVSLIPGILSLVNGGRHRHGDDALADPGPAGAGGVAVATKTAVHAPVLVPLLVLAGVLALRAAIIFPVHYYNWPGQ